MRKSLKVVFIGCAILAIAVGDGCGKKKSTAPAGYPDVSGSWAGERGDEAIPADRGDLMLQLSQQREKVTGTFVARYWRVSGNDLDTTTISGTVTGTWGQGIGWQLFGSMIGGGGDCEYNQGFTADLAGGDLAGTYVGHAFCETVIFGWFRLEKQ